MCCIYVSKLIWNVLQIVTCPYLSLFFLTSYIMRVFFILFFLCTVITHKRIYFLLERWHYKWKKISGCSHTGHSAYVATATELVGVKIDGLLPPNFCRFRKCKRKVPPPSLLSNDFEKSCFFSKFLVMIFFLFANKIFSTI